MERLQELFTHHMILPTYLMWIIFGVVITVLLFLDLFVFHKKDEEPTIGETFRLSAFYIIIALIFGVFIIYEHGMADGMLYYTGYLVEKSLSMDNIFVISLIFSSLNIPTKYQHRVLFWGVLGAIVMRALMIGIGAQLVSRFHWILYIFSFFLLYTGIKMISEKKDDVPLTETKLYQFIRKRFSVTKRLHNEHFFIHRNGRHFIYLKPALAVILIFIGSKIFLPYVGVDIDATHSLSITFGILFIGIIASLIKTKAPTAE